MHISIRLSLLLLFVLMEPAQNILGQSGIEVHISIFEPKKVSTDLVEYSSSFSSSGTEVFFARSKNQWGKGNMKSSIYYAVKENNIWSRPELVSFSGRYNDSDPHITQDGKTLFFISERPSKSAGVSADIWSVEKDNTGKWGEPARLESPLNSESREYSPRTDNEGNLYFASDRPGGFGQGDLYMAAKSIKGFDDPSNLGSTINSEKGEWNLEINGKGKLLIFEASQRKENVSPYGDLYISFKSGNIWSIPQNIKELNTSGSDLYPQLTNEDNFLFYTSSNSLKSVGTNIYFVEFMPFYRAYKKQAVFPE